MTIGFIFWFLMLCSLIVGIYWGWRTDRSAGWAGFVPWGMSLLTWVLLFLLGWHVFGWPIKD